MSIQNHHQLRICADIVHILHFDLTVSEFEGTVYEISWYNTVPWYCNITISRACWQNTIYFI